MFVRKWVCLFILFSCVANAAEVGINRPSARAVKSLSTWSSDQLLELMLLSRQGGYKGELIWMYVPAYDELARRRSQHDSQLIASLLIYYFGESDVSNILGDLACRRDYDKFVIPQDPKLLGVCRRDIKLECMLDDSDNYETMVDILKDLRSGETKCWPPRKRFKKR